MSRAIEAGRADIHAHLLPDVDDGPATIEESLDVARKAVADGTRRIVATPHVDRLDVLEVAERTAALQDALDGAGIELLVLPGGELQAADLWSLDGERLDAIACGPPGRQWVLLEAPWRGSADVVLAAFDEIRARGHGVVIAHPERSAGLWTDGEPLARLLDAGAWAQVTASSLNGASAEIVRARAAQVIRATSRVVIASDAHDASQRPPNLSSAIEPIAALGLGLPCARAIVDHTGETLLDDGWLPPGA